ncbi:MAG: hypothetical protein CUN56_14295, partial [Phototrophicales bacterium]
LTTLFVGGIVTGGIVIFLVILPITEVLAVHAGFELYNPDEPLVNWLSSISLIIVLLVMPFFRHMLAAQIEHPPRIIVRRTIRRIMFGFGLIENEPELSQLEHLYLGATSVTILANTSVLIFGFLGRVGSGSGVLVAVFFLIAILTYIQALDYMVLFIFRLFQNTVGDIIDASTHEERRHFFEQRREAYLQRYLEELLVAARAKQRRNQNETNNLMS